MAAYTTKKTPQAAIRIHVAQRANLAPAVSSLLGVGVMLSLIGGILFGIC